MTSAVSGLAVNGNPTSQAFSHKGDGIEQQKVSTVWRHVVVGPVASLVTAACTAEGRRRSDLALPSPKKLFPA
jgi:hypothetical protein